MSKGITMKQSRYQDISFDLLKLYPMDLKSLMLGLKKGGIKFIIYICGFYFTKLFYLMMNIITCDKTLFLKIAIEKCRYDNPKTRLIQVRAKDLKFGHPVGWSFDFLLNRRIDNLKQVRYLTTSKFNEICQSDAPPECYNNVLLNGNGRVKALIESGHGDFVLDILERYK